MAKGRFTGGRHFTPESAKKVAHLGGRPRVSEEVAEFRKRTREEFDQLMMKYTGCNLNALEEAARNPQTTVLEMLLIALIKKGVEHGDPQRLTFLADRLIGPPIAPRTIPSPIELLETAINATFIQINVLNQKAVTGAFTPDEFRMLNQLTSSVQELIDRQRALAQSNDATMMSDEDLLKESEASVRRLRELVKGKKKAA